jgi:septal ring factor EnvC (AmiA/AmiB activator)
MRMRFVVPVAIACLGLTVGLAAQTPPPAAGSPGARVTERIRALEREAEQLAGQAKTLLTELRKLEVARDLRVEESRAAATAATAAEQTLQDTTTRLRGLEEQRVSQLPDLKRQFAELYKRGQGGYARVLVGAGSARELARATRAVAALTTINQRRIEDHRRTIEAVRKEQDAQAAQGQELAKRQAEARAAQTAAERAVAARAALVAQIDSRRDLTAQYVGELQVAYDQLQRRLTEEEGGTAAAIPLVPFRGALDWPAPGRLSGRFGQTSGRLGGTAVRNGIEIAATEGAPVRAVHGGTVGHADTFTGFGTLVILEHGANNFSLYGYLGAASVQKGDVVEAGRELGRVGLAPAGPPALYFEMRIDGKSVDPVQWLKPR